MIRNLLYTRPVRMLQARPHGRRRVRVEISVVSANFSVRRLP
jgi:hypothetical protein